MLFGVNYVLTKTMSPATYESVEDDSEDRAEGEGEGGHETLSRAADASAQVVAGEIASAVSGTELGDRRGDGGTGVADGRGSGDVDLNHVELQPMNVVGLEGGSARVATAYPRVRGFLSMIAQVGTSGRDVAGVDTALPPSAALGRRR